MEQPNIQHIENLLPRYCAGEVTPEEREIVDVWLRESSENRRIAKQIQTLYLAADTVSIMKKVDTEKALKRVKNKMIVKRTSPWEWTQRIAAILSIPLLITLSVQYMSGGDELARMIEVKTNPGMITTVVLPDSTIVYLNSESSLRYPSQFGKTREVTLSGEAYFEVAKDAKKKFIVTASHHTQIEVLGTHFNVEAYEGDVEISTTLVEGKVCFLYETPANVIKKRMMTPGQRLVYNSVDSNVQLYETSCLSETAWKDGKIIFSDTPLEAALKMLEKHFNVTFIIKSKSLMDYSFTGAFAEQRLERILEYFKVSSKIRWRYLESPDVRDERSKIEIY